MLNKNIITLLIILLLIILTLSLFLYEPYLARLTGKTVEENIEYSYTKAICNETNFCQDYEIICRNKIAIEFRPLTGATIQHSDDWKDPRNNSKDLCN